MLPFFFVPITSAAACPRLLTPKQDYSLDACAESEDDYRIPKPSEWGYGLTVCIAAITGRAGLDYRPDAIVTASDTRVSFEGQSSADGSLKLHLFHKDWGSMMAGNNIGHAVPVIEKAKAILRGKPGEFQVVMDGFKQAYKQQIRDVIEDELLSPFAMSLPEFKKKGRAQLNPEVFADLSFQIRRFRLGCTFLIFGLNSNNGIAHIFTVQNGVVEVHDKPGFWAIGNGARSALAMLSALNQVRGRTPFYETVYNVLASKYFSEKASDIGSETVLWVQVRGSRGFSTKKDLEVDIRKIWEGEGVPKTSATAVEKIKNGEWKFTPRTKRSKIRMSMDWL